MKKFCILFITVMLLGASGCSGNNDTQNPSGISDNSIVAQSPSKIKKDIGNLLNKLLLNYGNPI